MEWTIFKDVLTIGNLVELRGNVFGYIYVSFIVHA